MKLGDVVRVKDLKHLAPGWRGKVGNVSSIYREKEPFFYEVTIEGFELVFLGDELELVKGGDVDDKT